MERVYIPVMRYVGGEEYEVVDREVRDTDATAAQIRTFLAHGFDPSFFNRLHARSVTNSVGAWEREFQRMERYQRRAERRLWIILQRRLTSL